jgi:hypothetical protein
VHGKRDNRYTLTLQRAMELVGGKEALAAALRTSPEVLATWLSGELAPPIKPYLAALELVALATPGSSPSGRR